MQGYKHGIQLEVEVFIARCLSRQQFVTHNGPNAFYEQGGFTQTRCVYRKVSAVKSLALAGKKPG